MTVFGIRCCSQLEAPVGVLEAVDEAEVAAEGANVRNAADAVRVIVYQYLSK